MHVGMLRSRAGFTLAEVLVALTMTAVIGAAVTGAFVSQSRFFDHQEKVGSARNVSRSAINVLMSELRMVERSGGVVLATNSAITLRVPYALGLYCTTAGGAMKISRMPVDSAMYAAAVYSGYAYRTSPNTYTYVPGTLAPSDGTDTSDCTGLSTPVAVPGPVTTTGWRVTSIPLGVALTRATPVFLFQDVTYQFKNSTAFAGRRGLYRATTAGEEELLAPFDTTAKFRFFVNDAATAQTAAPTLLNTVTGIEVTLDGLSQRPNPDGSRQSAPLKTAVFFRNR
jgi:prepilin-type N-terminal cleavage/methylation domain-containing protein